MDKTQDFNNAMMPWLGKTMKLIDMFVSSALSQNGISLTRKQVIMMKILFEKGPLPQSNLAFLTERDKASLTRLINSMEKKNLVARITSPEDKRVNLIHLTVSGEKVFQEVHPVLLSVMKDLQKGISPEEKTMVISAMKKIQENIQLTCKGCNSN